MIYEVIYVWNVPTPENLSRTERVVAHVEAASFAEAIDQAADALEAQAPPRANMYVDVGDRRCFTAWVKAAPDDPYDGHAHVGWNSEFVYQPTKHMRWYAAVGMPRLKEQYAAR